MTTHPKTLSFIAAAVLLAATALPAAAQRDHGGGGGGGGGVHMGGGGGGGTHFGGGGGGMMRGGGGGAAHFSAPRASGGSHGLIGSRGAVHVQRSGLLRSHARTAAHNRAGARANITHTRHGTVKQNRRNREASAETRQHRTAAHEKAQTARQRRAAAHDKAQTARQNRGAARANAQTTRQNRFARTQATRQGRFAARFNNNARRVHVAFRPNRWAWRHGWYAGFVPWFGPVWWPYAYADIFGFAFWPYGYDPGYWYYAYDDFFDGVYYGSAGPGPAYASAGGEVASTRNASRKVNSREVAQLCRQPGEGLTAWPTAEINSKLQLTAEQKPLFEDLQTAGKQAAEIFAESCPRDPNLAATPTGRLEAMTVRLDATLRSVEAVKPALDKFYASLTDEQKERFNEIGPKNKEMMAAARKRTETQGSGGGQQAACNDPKPGLTNLPIERIQDTVHPSEAQQASLKELEQATNQAVATLQAACPDDVPLTPPGRLDAMETRLKAMLEAANTVKPALDGFYGSLDNEQKARFNRLDRQVASND